MKNKGLPKRDYCYYCQKRTRLFYGVLPNHTIEYRSKNVIYDEVIAFCSRCHIETKYELGEVWDENLRRIKDNYNKGHFEKIGE